MGAHVVLARMEQDRCTAWSAGWRTALWAVDEHGGHVPVQDVCEVAAELVADTLGVDAQWSPEPEDPVWRLVERGMRAGRRAWTEGRI